MGTWQRTLLGVLLVGAVAAAGIAFNFTLLRLTQDAHDPVGKLSPRAVFSDQTATSTTSTTSTTTTTVPTPTGTDADGDSDD